MIDKVQLERMYKHSLKVKKVLFIISLVLFGLATAAIVGLIVLLAMNVDVLLMPEFLEDITLRVILIDLAETFIAGGLVCILFSFLIFARRARFAKAMLDNFDQQMASQARTFNSKPSGTPIVDVKPVEPQQNKYAGLITEYQKLYEQGVITKEEFEAKKKELMN